jgi:hypothetical protein
MMGYGPQNFNYGAMSAFYQANSLVAKFAFLVMVLLVFIVILRVGTAILAWYFSPPENPILLDGMIDATKTMIIPQNPLVKGAIPVSRSDNEIHGMEFTWSVWIFIESSTFNSSDHRYKHIFHKGTDKQHRDDGGKNNGTYYPNNAPGLYIDQGPTGMSNDLLLKMNTYDDIEDNITITGVPLNKWVNVIIRLNKQNQMDVYINGTLTKRHMLSGIGKQNYEDVFLSMNGGFNGYTSELRYFNSAIGTTQIYDLVSNGPNLKSKSENLIKSTPRYLSSRWYFEEAQDI